MPDCAAALDADGDSTQTDRRFHAGAEQLIRAVGLRMAVDGDGDSAVTFGNPADTNALFWVNNDCDIEKHNKNMWQEDDADPDKTAHQDCSDNHIGNKATPGQGACLRDLEDFMRLHVKLDGDLAGLAGLLWKLSFEPVEGGAPAVSLFEAVDGTDGFHSVRTNAVLQAQETKAAFADAEPRESDFRPAFTNGLAPFVLEGARAGKGCMTAKLYWHSAEVGRASVALDIRDIKKFYDIRKITASGSGWQATVPSAASTINTADPDIPFAGGRLLIVFGWNMEDWEKARWAETVFKRLWWQGCRGRITLFNWPCQYYKSQSTVWNTLTDPRNFDNSEYLGWQSGAALAALMEELNADGNLSVIAHSQGNIVVAEALRKYSGLPVKNYIAAQAAVSAHCYDGSVSAVQPAVFPDEFIPLVNGLVGIVTTVPQTPDIAAHFPFEQYGFAPYMTDAAAKVTKKYNFFNEVDYALNLWMGNNALKPDRRFGYTGDWTVPTNYLDPDNHFYRNAWPLGLGLLSTTLMPFPNELERYQIFAYAAESHSAALGQVTGGVAGFNGWDLQMDPVLMYDDQHYSHSREFRSNLADEYRFWLWVKDILLGNQQRNSP